MKKSRRGLQGDFRPVEREVVRREEKNREASTLGGVSLSKTKVAIFPGRRKARFYV